MSLIGQGLGYGCMGCGTAPPYGQNQSCTTPFGPSFPHLSIQKTQTVLTAFTPLQKTQIMSSWSAARAPMARSSGMVEGYCGGYKTPDIMYPGVN